MTSEPEVVVQPSAEELAASTADRACATLAAAITARGVAQLVVTGGGILEKVLAELAPRAEVLDWSAVHVWWADERFVGAKSDDRNDLPAMAKLFSLVPIDPAKLHRMPDSDAYDTAEAAADAYQADLLAAGDGQLPTFDVVLLGLGPDGHCASLFPGREDLLEVTDRSVIAVHDSPKPPADRLSFTFPALDAAREIWLIASGDGKADAVGRAVGGDTSLPSARPRGLERTVWLLDEDAAAKIS